MSFTTPTVDVYVPGTTLGLGNVNASTINIGQAGTTVNVGGTMAVTNSVTTPSCTMSSLTTGNLIISPFSGNVAFNNFSAVSANINTASMINASFNSLNSSNILIGPYPISGTYTNMNVTNATVSTLNVSNFLITPLSNNPTFTNVNTTTINSTGLITAGGITMGTGKNITLQPTAGYVAPSVGQLGYVYPTPTYSAGSFTSGNVNTYGSQSLTAGVYIISCSGYVNTAGAVINSFSGIITDGTTVYARQTPYAVSSNTLYSDYTWTTNPTAVVSLSSTKTISFIITIYYTSGTCSPNSSGYQFNIVKIA